MDSEIKFFSQKTRAQLPLAYKFRCFSEKTRVIPLSYFITPSLITLEKRKTSLNTTPTPSEIIKKVVLGGYLDVNGLVLLTTFHNTPYKPSVLKKKSPFEVRNSFEL